MQLSLRLFGVTVLELTAGDGDASSYELIDLTGTARPGIGFAQVERGPGDE
jgi:hypothetical protein